MQITLLLHLCSGRSPARWQVELGTQVCVQVQPSPSPGDQKVTLRRQAWADQPARLGRTGRKGQGFLFHILNYMLRIISSPVYASSRTWHHLFIFKAQVTMQDTPQPCRAPGTWLESIFPLASVTLIHN